MAEELGLDARALLAMLRREGGYWTPAQLAHHWQPTWSQAEVLAHCQALARSGHVISRPSLANRQVPSYSARPEASGAPVQPPPFARKGAPMSDPTLNAAATASAAAMSPPDEDVARRVLALTQMLLGAVQHASPKDRLDGLLSAYFNAVLRSGDETELRNGIAGLAGVRMQLLEQLPRRPAATVVDTVDELARLIVQPSLRGVRHDIALGVLITAYRNTVMNHPCCLAAAAGVLLDLSQQMAAAAAPLNATPAHVH
jgi:hypothetical protein